MRHSLSQLGQAGQSAFPRVGRSDVPASSDRTMRDLGAADDAFGEVSPELAEGLLLAGRYLVLRRLGRGGFSDVYLAHDHNLDRPVAIKRLLRNSVDPRFIKDEAKTLASLDHPGIVRIFDVCHDPDQGYLVVMQYVPGPVLREVLTQPLSIHRAVELAIRISGGLIHAHARGVVHRDIKPTNILMSNEGDPLIADFGLAFTPKALCESEGGTPRYMSPEQIRNETKRIGPSSDIFSTGILLYEMLAGRVPFDGETPQAIAQATLEQSPVSIHALNPDVPMELDRIVRRALRKNVKDRHSSMEAFQADLIQWLNHQDSATELSTMQASDGDRSQAFDSTSASTVVRSMSQFTHRGLQPFEAEDAKFFLSLVPGAKSPSGLPESLQFWKDWIEGYENTEYTRVGILYGPSGSGKTSLVRAGIMPHLAPDVLPITIECRKGESLARFAWLIGQQVNSESTDLAELLLALRDDVTLRGQHRKAVLLLDQFDNWAGSATSPQLAQFAAALRHCDGESLQTLLIVRDDFWISATEFVRMVECGVGQWKNARAIELLDCHLARRLLEAAGRNYGSLPARPEALDPAQTGFIAQAIDEMSDKGRVLPVQLAMFAKMAKLQRWHIDSLVQIGGVHGAYSGYFQDLFEGSAAPPSYQRVFDGVVEVLHRLLPCADQTVLDHQVEFVELEKTLAEKKLQNQLHRILAILVEDLRVVVRISQPDCESPTPSEYAVQCNDRFQLVHDFLTVPISNWVDQVLKSSWSGRSRARLNELSTMWNRKKHGRYLPSLSEFLVMQVAIPVGKRSPLHQRFLRRAARKHLLRSTLALAVIASMSFAAYSILNEHRRNLEAHRQQVIGRVEAMIRGELSDFLPLMNMHNLGEDQKPVTEALRPWMESTNEKLRTRTRLLTAAINQGSFESLIIDLDKFEPQLCNQVIAVARECPDAPRMLTEVCNNSSASDTAKIRAAITLASLGHEESLAAMLDYNNSPRAASESVLLAMNWQVVPGLWIDLALAQHSPGATYYALCFLGSFPETQLPAEMPWREIAALQAASDPGVSSAAAWLLGKTDTARHYLAPQTGHHRRVLKPGLEQVRIESRDLTLAKPIKLIAEETHVSKHWEMESHIRVEEPFWICLAAVTNADFEVFQLEFEKTLQSSLGKPIVRSRERAPELEIHSGRAVTGLNPILLLEFCNWLSRREGLEPAYDLSPTVPLDSAASQPSFRSIVGANGFRLPTFSQIACASAVGTIESALPEVAVKIFEQSHSLVDRQESENHFKISRLVKDILPNHLGVHFDFEAYHCWALEEGQIWSFISTPIGMMVFPISTDNPQHLTALWLVADCHDPQVPVASVATQSAP